METDNKQTRFYDVHCHAMNLSHPNLLTFVQRILRGLKKRLILIIVCSIFILSMVLYGFKKWTATPLELSIAIAAIALLIAIAALPQALRIFNLLAIMENDTGNIFILLENCLMDQESKSRAVLEQNRLIIGDTEFDTIVLTPLVMDFGKKMKAPWHLRTFYYKKPIQKAVKVQTVDLFNGIKFYTQAHAKNSSRPLFEIYPFLGITACNYSSGEIEAMLNKYFCGYTGKREDLFKKMGAFDGDIDAMDSNFFAGIKVYPPLGFDPWPDDAAKRAKMECIYKFCGEKKIPITSHCSDGGFRILDDKRDLLFTSPRRWESVLENYPSLKLDLAHMGKQERCKKEQGETWEDTVFRLIACYDNVYTDFACCAFKFADYDSILKSINIQSKKLKKILDRKNYKLEDKVLFGSDFMINLIWTDSYNRYLKTFRDYKGGGPDMARWKLKFCQENPERFLFG